MNNHNFLSRQSNRRDAYQLLSTFYYPPDQEALAKLPALQTALRDLCPAAAPHLAQMQTEQDLEALQIDFASLFVGPFKLLAPPYGSVYLENKREVMGESTIDAKNRYQEAGLELSGQIKEAPDHIAFELEFIYFLIYKQFQALEQSNVAQTIYFLEKQKGFLTRHLGSWVTKFAAAVQQNATTDFYKNLATTTSLFVQQDLTDILQIPTAQLTQLVQQQVI